MRKLSLFMLMAVGLLISGNAWAEKTLVATMTALEQTTSFYTDEAEDETNHVYASAYDALTAALAALPDNSTPAKLVLMTNVNVDYASKYYTVDQHENVTINLNGYTLSGKQDLPNGSAFISNKGTLTIEDVIEDNPDQGRTTEGKITTQSTNADIMNIPGYGSYTILNSGTLILNSGIVENTSEGGACYCVENHAGAADIQPTFIMNGGKLTQQHSSTMRISAWNNATGPFNVTINGGVLDASGYIFSTQFSNKPQINVTINGGTFISQYNPGIHWNSVSSNGNNDDSHFVINGGNFDFDIRIDYGTSTKAMDISVKGGVFRKNPFVFSSNDATNFISGGIFKGFNPSATSTYNFEESFSKEKYTEAQFQEFLQTCVVAEYIDYYDKCEGGGWSGAADYWMIIKDNWECDDDALDWPTKNKFPDKGVIEGMLRNAEVIDNGDSWSAKGTYTTGLSEYELFRTDSKSLIAEGYAAVACTEEGFNPQTDLMITTTSTKETDNDGSWATPETWLPENAPDAATDVTIKNEIVVASGTAVAHGVTVNEGQIIVKNGAVLEIGAGGIKTNNHDLQPIIVEAGGTLRVGVGGVSNEAGTLNPVEIYNDGTNSGAFMINPNAQVNTMPEATIHLTTNVRKGYWQHLALPIENLTEHSNDKSAANAVFEWKDNDWNQLGGWDEIKAFKGYDFTNNYEGEGQVTYTFKGQLIGIQNQGLSLIEGVNFFGNSYTAPISLKALFDQIGSDMAANTIEKTVYIYNSSTLNYGFTSQLGIQLAEMGFADLDFMTIAPLQGFWMNLQEGKGTAGTTLNYAKAVWNNTEELGKPQYAPSRNGNSSNFSTVATINVTAANGAADKVMLVEGEDFSSEFENGSDASKMMSEESFNLFATTENGNQSMVATDDLEGTILSFQAADAINYTLNFSHIHGNEYAIRDLKTGTIIPMVENGTYNFVAQPNSVEDRFAVVATYGVSTNNQQVVAAPAVKGIYSISGQYMGKSTNWDKMPAGVYIVDGIRIAK